MKTLGRLFVVLVALCAIAVTYHQWYGPVTTAVPTLKQYLPAPTPAPTAQPVTVAPLPLNTAVPSLAPGPAPAPPIGAVPWSAADCTWALSTMQEDEHLDQQEAWAIAEGFDPRYPNLSYEAAYVQWEDDWLIVVGQVQSMCSTGVPVSADHISQAEGFFAEALASHPE